MQVGQIRVLRSLERSLNITYFISLYSLVYLIILSFFFQFHKINRFIGQNIKTCIINGVVGRKKLNLSLFIFVSERASYVRIIVLGCYVGHREEIIFHFYPLQASQSNSFYLDISSCYVTSLFMHFPSISFNFYSYKYHLKIFIVRSFHIQIKLIIAIKAND